MPDLAALPVRPGDRVLFLSVAGASVIEFVSGRLGHGIVVCIGGREEIAAGRRAAAHLDNVMFTPGTLDEIPWQDAFFNWIVEPAGGWNLAPAEAREVARVLAPDGQVWLAGVEPSPLTELGFVEAEAQGGFAAVRRLPPTGL